MTIVRHSRNRGPWKSVLVLAVFCALIWLGVYLSTPGEPTGPVIIRPGDGVASIIGELKEKGAVRSGLIFGYTLRRSGAATRLQPGEYDLAGLGSYTEIIERLTTGSLAADELVLRIIEGWDLEDIAKEMRRLGLPAGDSLYSVAGEPAYDYRLGDWSPPAWLADEYPFLATKPEKASLEGYLFPDTYRVFRDLTAEEAVRMFLDNFGRRLTPGHRERVADAGRGLHEIIIMASIIENEVRSDEDRRMVSDIFWRRLGINMALQADSTVNYFTRQQKVAVSSADTWIDSPFNTYRHPGLPLGPISNPGLSAIEAALDPLGNDYWYFLTDADGSVHYARTLDEHNHNKSLYLK